MGKIHIIVNDFIDCGAKYCCDKCKAHELIEGTEDTYCDLLSLYRRNLQDKIEEVIENN